MADPGEQGEAQNRQDTDKHKPEQPPAAAIHQLIGFDSGRALSL
jgi:hypothetical protein